MVRCPECGTDNGEGAITCNSCGKPLYLGHALSEATYLGQQQYLYSNNLVLGTAVILTIVALIAIPMVALAPENMRLTYALAAAFTLLVITGIAYGVYRSTSTEGPIQIGGQEFPSVQGSSSESISDQEVEDPANSGTILKGIRPL